MVSAIVENKELKGEIAAIADESLLKTLLILLSLNSGGIISNYQRTKKIENLVFGLNQLGADIVINDEVIDIFPISKKEYQIDLKNDLELTRYMMGLSFFSFDKTKLINPKIPKICKKLFFEYAKYSKVRIHSLRGKMEIDSKNMDKNYLPFEGIEGSFFAAPFIISAASFGIEFLAVMDDYNSTLREIYDVANAFDIAEYEYFFDENKRSFFVAQKYFREEKEIELPPSVKFSMYYLAALLLNGKGKVKIPTTLYYPEIKLIENISHKIKKYPNFFEIENKEEEFEFPSEIKPQGMNYFLPILFILGTKAKKTFKIGPFVPYKQKKLKELEEFASQLVEIGAKIKYIDNYFEISPSKLYGGIIEPTGEYNTMAAIIAGIICKSPLKVKNIEQAVVKNKNFIDDLKKLEASIKI
ncbi:MAG: hypothetical protein QXV83_01430 [Candidatus Anstonellaceae archaeon]